MNRNWIHFAIVLLLLPIPSSAQQLPQPTTTLTSNSNTLQLPGSLKLTATVAPPAETGGMPSGNVQFLNNGTTAIGTAPLTAIPSTENFSAQGTFGTLGYLPYGIFTLPSVASKDSVVGVLDYGVSGETFYPQLTIYSGQGSGLFGTSTPYLMTNSSISLTYQGVDAFAVADFNHDGYPDVLVHGYSTQTEGNEYYVLPGDSAGTYNVNSSVISPDYSGMTCECTSPTETIAVDDFNGDGYPDVAYAGSRYNSNGLIGVALNGGAANPATFPQDGFMTAPTVPIIGTADAFVPEAIASGHFTASGHADLVAAGYFPSTVSTGALALFTGNGDGTFGTTPQTFVTAANPVAIATGDFRNNGMTDVVAANGSFLQASGTTIQVFWGNGAGSLTVSSTPTYCSIEGAPETAASLLVQDFNNDGFPDVLGTDTDGTLCLMLNDGAGHLGAGVIVGAGQEAQSLTAAGDFNGDGLADIVQITDNSTNYEETSDSTASEYLNSASSQAVLTTAPKTLPAGTDTLTATVAANVNFGASTSNQVPVTVTQTPSSITWAQPAAIEYGTALSATQLDAAASVAGAISYTPAAGTVLHAGVNTLTAMFVPTDAFDYTGATATQTITVTQVPSTLTWAQPAAIEYGTPLSATQLNAESSVAGAITYAPAAGTVLPPGATNVIATFVPTDTTDYTGATKTVPITVTAPSFTGISPSSASLGAGNTTVTIAGQGLVNGATVFWNTTALATTFVSLNQLTAVVPASLLTAKGTGTITVVDPNNIPVAGSQTFTIIAQSAVASANAQATISAGQSGSLTLTVNPYPVAITAAINLLFIPDPPNTVVDPTVVFSNNTTTQMIQIPANSTAAIPAIDFSTGSTAGTIQITITLDAGGADVTPANLTTPVAVVVPATAPVINSATVSRSSDTLTVAILGLSSTRDMSQATFHFTPAAGQSLSTSDFTVDLTGAFGTWYTSSASDQFGTTFLYTQPFSLNSDATHVGSVTVTLQNSQGQSEPVTAQ